MDNSGSMGSVDISSMKAATNAFIGAVRSGDRGAIIKFSSTASAQQAFTTDLAALHASVNAALFEAVGLVLENANALAWGG